MAARTPDDVARWFRDRHIEHVLHRDLERVHTVQEAAAVLGVPASAIAKTVVFDHAGAPVAVLAPGTHKVRDRLVVSHLASTRNALRLARPDQVLEWTGYPVGGVPPAAHAGPVRILMDDALLLLGRVVFGGGTADALLELDPRALAAALHPETGRFSEAV